MQSRLFSRGLSKVSFLHTKIPSLGYWVIGTGVFTSWLISLVGAVVTGVSWDEHFHLQMIGNWAELGWYARYDVLRDYDFVSDDGSLYVYGPVTSMILHVAAVLSGAEEFGVASLSADAYVARHIATALIGIAGSVAVGVLVWVATGSKYWGGIGTLMISAFPLWLGHGMFNLKDTPVAAGYTLSTLGIAILATSFAYPKLRTLTGALLLSGGTLLAVGTRPAMWLPILGTVALSVLVISLLAGANKSYKLRVFIPTSIASLGFSYLILAAIYPKLFLSIDKLVLSAFGSSSYPWTGRMLVGGEWLSTPPPWFYAPVLFLAQTPLYIWTLLAIGGIAGVIALRKIPHNGARFSGTVYFKPLLVTVLMMSQAGALLFYAIVSGSNLYDGVRQLLFVIPALSGLASIAGFVISRFVSSTLSLSIITVGVSATLLAHAALFPYNYVYVNPAASVKGVDGVWMTDYWATSGRELVPLIPTGAPVACDYWDGFREFELCADKPQYSPYWADVSSLAEPLRSPNEGQWVLVRPNRGEATPPSGCELVDSVTRKLWAHTVTMGWIGVCEAPKIN